MAYTINTFTLAWFATILAFLAGALAIWLPRHLNDVGRGRIIGLGAVWVALTTLEYWIFGPASFIPFTDEGSSVVPLIEVVRNGGAYYYAHGINGGSDLLAQFPAGVQLVSLERLLFQLLPLWLAIAVHKIILTSVATFGMALLCRRVVGTTRLLALALGCVFSVMHIYVTDVTLSHGLGYALFPLAVLMVVGRLEERNYFLPVLAVAALNAASSTVALSFIAFGVGLVAVALLMGVRRWGRLAAALTIILVLEVLNNAPYLLATTVLAPDSARLSNRSSSLPFMALMGLAWDYLNWKFGILFVPALVAALFMGIRRAVSWRLRAVPVLVGSILIGPLLQAAPWASVGLGMLAAVQWGYYLAFGIPPLLLLYIAHVVGVESVAARGTGRWVLALVVASSLALSAGRKVFQWVDLVGVGSQAALTRVGNLANRSWECAEPYRVASVPYRFVPGFVEAYGLQSADGYLNLIPRQRAEFWQAVTRADRVANEGMIDNRLYLFDNHLDFDARCCASFDAARYVDLDLLGMVNTRYLVSFVPLHGGGLRKVSGPEDWLTSRRERPLSQKLKEDLAAIFHPADAFIYELPNVLPRAYFAREVSTIKGGPDYKSLARGAYDRVIQVTTEDAGRLGPIGGTDGTVKAVTEGANTISVQIEGADGGVLVLNYTHPRFWRAEINGKVVPVVEANGVQMALSVPPGASQVTLHYERRQ